MSLNLDSLMRGLMISSGVGRRKRCCQIWMRISGGRLTRRGWPGVGSVVLSLGGRFWGSVSCAEDKGADWGAVLAIVESCFGEFRWKRRLRSNCISRKIPCGV